ncbi:9511_t:CDS:1, partial [Paraglomus occultum]
MSTASDDVREITALPQSEPEQGQKKQPDKDVAASITADGVPTDLRLLRIYKSLTGSQRQRYALCSNRERLAVLELLSEERKRP